MNKRDLIHADSRMVWLGSGCRGTLCLATGVGKSKIAIDALVDQIERFGLKKALLVVPTEKLRDENWHDEFVKWGKEHVYNTNVERECYASLNKMDLSKYDLVILDEVQNITPNNSKDLVNYKGKILGLTATPPNDFEKQLILQKLAPVVYVYTMDQAVNDGVISPFIINIVEMNLDNQTKNIEAGNKANRFMTTEAAGYEFNDKRVNQLMYSTDPKAKKALEFAILARMRYVYNLPSKTLAAKKIMNKFLTGRNLIFCGSIKQAEELCENRYHSKSKDTDLTRFINGEIDTLSCVNALNEGMNIPNLDGALIVQVNSNPIRLIQRIGRVVRFREGHRGTIWILTTLNTQDEKWVKKAIEGIDPSSINYINIKNLHL